MFQDIYVNIRKENKMFTRDSMIKGIAKASAKARKENKMQKVKIKFSVITPCEKEYKIFNMDLWNARKDDFLAIAKSDDCQEVFSDERWYGLDPIEDSFYEDSPNREVHKVENVVIDGKNQWY